jgi:hypothetical protein
MKTNFKNESQQEMIQTETRVFTNPISDFTPNEHMGIEQITLNEDNTQIDFVYISPKDYKNGGWIQMDANCFIRPVGSEIRYKMIQAINIPIAPNKYHFKRSGQVLRFSLLFPALPKEVKAIDFIEKDAKGTYFNFFNIALQHNEPTLIRIINEN